MPAKHKMYMAGLRLSCQKLEMETGGYHKPYSKPAHEKVYADSVLLAGLKTRHILLFPVKNMIP